MRLSHPLEGVGPWETTTLIGGTCKHGNVFSGPVLIVRGLDLNTAKSLWSFEGAGRIRCTAHRLSGGLSGGETPLPFPNREVKPASADGTRRATSRESRTPPEFLRGSRAGWREPRPISRIFARWRLGAQPWPSAPGDRLQADSAGRSRRLSRCPAQAARSVSRQSVSRSRRRRTRSPIGGCVLNIADSRSSPNGFTRYRGSMAGLPRNETSSIVCSSLSRASASPWGVPAERGGWCVGRGYPFRRQGHVHDSSGQRGQHEQQRALEVPADAARLDEPEREQDDRCLDRRRRDALRGRAPERELPRSPPETRDSRSLGSPRPRVACSSSHDERARMSVGKEVELRTTESPAAAASRSMVVARSGDSPTVSSRAPSDVEKDSRAVPVDDRGHEECDCEKHARKAKSSKPPAESGKQRSEASEEQECLRDVTSRVEPRHYVSPSASPRGGQSGSGASHRLEQWSDATFWRGIRM